MAIHPIVVGMYQSDHQTDISIPWATSIKLGKAKPKNYWTAHKSICFHSLLIQVCVPSCSGESISQHVFYRLHKPSLIELKRSQHQRQIARFSSVTLASPGPPSYSSEVFSLSTFVSFHFHVCVSVFPSTCSCVWARELPLVWVIFALSR